MNTKLLSAIGISAIVLFGTLMTLGTDSIPAAYAKKTKCIERTDESGATFTSCYTKGEESRQTFEACDPDGECNTTLDREITHKDATKGAASDKQFCKQDEVEGFTCEVVK